MQLYSVTVTGVFPPQCVTVWDDKEKCEALAAYLNETSNLDDDYAVVWKVDSFFPAGMCDADKAWLDATETWLKQQKAGK